MGRAARALFAVALAAGACGVPDYKGFATGGGAAGADGGGATGGATCASDLDCKSLVAPRCDPNTKICVECLEPNATCPQGTYCDGGKCAVGCSGNTDCGTLTCDVSSHRCTGCTGSGQCPTGTTCETSSGVCQPGCSAGPECPNGFDCCNDNCVNLQSTPEHCGACDAACSTAGGTPSCSDGDCTIACDPGFADCDNKARPNGCEVSTATDPTNCGSCGNACGVAAPNCESGACKSACPAGKADCDGKASNGCETDLNDSKQDCGACGNACSTTQYCSNGSCTACPSGKRDCDGDGGNSCEVTLATDPANCGTCGNSCGGCACSGGSCSSSGVLFSETFSGSGAGWTMTGEWEIGPAQASTGHTFGFPDPSTDTTPTSDNRIAGAIIGGNSMSGAIGHLTSPVINLASVSGSVTLKYRRWLNSQPSDDDAVSVHNGTSWVQLWISPPTTGTQDSSWTTQTHDVTAHKNAAFQIRFTADKDATAAIASGWNLDDVELVSAACP